MSKCREVTKQEQSLLKRHFKLVGDSVVCKKTFKKLAVGTVMASGQGNKHRKVMHFDGNFYPLHRVIYFLYTGVWPLGVVDHINGDWLDNRPENLRDVTQSENTKSYAPAHKDSSSRFRGVHWFKRDSRWQAQIMCNGKRYHIGYFNTEEEAALAWNYKALEFGFNKEAFNKVFEDPPKVRLEDLV